MFLGLLACLAVAAGGEVAGVNVAALRRAVEDLSQSFGERYPKGGEYLAALDALDAAGDAERMAALSRNALLANPLLDFDRLLVVKRNEKALGLSQNWESNSSLPPTGYDNEIAVLSLSDGALTTVFRPEHDVFVGDVDLEFDAERMLFSMPGAHGRWQVLECDVDGSDARPLALIEQPDVDNYDACYLPDGNIVFCSTAPFVGVPCVTGSAHVCNLFLLDRGNGGIRRLTFEQDHDWCPTVLNNGRILYLRWEYSDLPHFASRILFHMNPDGTGQMEYYGSNSYWPNAMFYARPVPGEATQFVAIVGGHHDVPRMGELVLFDTAKGRREADGVVQRIPGFGKKVEPILLDGLVKDSWPKFLHPFPLSAKYFLVSSKPAPDAKWGIYLVDVFDNRTLLKEIEGYALFEPIPLRKTARPPAIPARVQPARKDAVVYLTDLYAGNGLKGVPRGTVKQLRLFTYHFAYHGVGGQVNRIGLDGPWDIKRVLGTVPVEADGSAYFRVPANTPISVQPLDAEGKALQLMRSWMTAMPGETLSCVGCHESQNTTPPAKPALAMTRAPSEIAPWYGPARGFSFAREVQPVLDAYCVTCHNGAAREDGLALPDFRPLPFVHPDGEDNGYRQGSIFTPSYLALRRFVRSPTIESDMHLLPPGEFHADTAKVVQRLRQGHHGVTLDAEAWDRLITWIDLGTPAHGTWHEIVGMEKVANQRDRRRAMSQEYAGIDEDPEAIVPTESGFGEVAAAGGGKTNTAAADAVCPGWPFGAEEAARRQQALGTCERVIDLGEGVELKLRLIPAGEFLMGDRDSADAGPLTRVSVSAPYWMGTCEITNEQYARFDAAHDSRLEHGDFLQFSVEERGYPVNGPRQPVCRVSWDEAMQFCAWLAETSGEAFTLPTEAQWEYACRAGGDTPMGYGAVEADFAPWANLADASLRNIDTYAPWTLPSGAIAPWRPAIEAVDDGYRVSAPVGSFQPNAWGLVDMHGNVAEWTRSAYVGYPYEDGDSRNDAGPGMRRVIRGGSWYDRPQDARAGRRRDAPPWLGVFDVGFRVACPAG